MDVNLWVLTLACLMSLNLRSDLPWSIRNRAWQHRKNIYPALAVSPFPSPPRPTPFDCHLPFPSPLFPFSPPPYTHPDLSRSGAGELGDGAGAMHALSPPHARSRAWAADGRWWGQPGGVVHREWARWGRGGQRRGGGRGSGRSSRDGSGGCGGRGGDGAREGCLCSVVERRM